MTCRLFIDEVGNGDLRGSATDDNVRYLSLTGILTTLDSHDRRITPAINALKHGVFGNTSVVLHRRDIVRREGPFRILHDPEPKRQFDDGLRECVRAVPYLVTTVTIDKRSHLERYAVWRYDPYHYCLCCLIERYVFWLRRHDLRGDVAIEPRFKLGDKKLKQSFRKLYRDGTQNIPSAMIQGHLLSGEIKFFPKKANIAAMQLCDMLAHPSYRSMKFMKERLPEPDDYGTSLVNILRERKYARNPLTGTIYGWGRKWLP